MSQANLRHALLLIRHLHEQMTSGAVGPTQADIRRAADGALVPAIGYLAPVVENAARIILGVDQAGMTETTRLYEAAVNYAAAPAPRADHMIGLQVAAVAFADSGSVDRGGSPSTSDADRALHEVSANVDVVANYDRLIAERDQQIADLTSTREALIGRIASVERVVRAAFAAVVDAGHPDAVGARDEGSPFAALAALLTGVRCYSVHDSYEKNEKMWHPALGVGTVFGSGTVTSGPLSGDVVDVQFSDGVSRLPHHRVGA